MAERPPTIIKRFLSKLIGSGRSESVSNFSGLKEKVWFVEFLHCFCDTQYVDSYRVREMKWRERHFIISIYVCLVWCWNNIFDPVDNLSSWVASLGWTRWQHASRSITSRPYHRCERWLQTLETTCISQSAFFSRSSWFCSYFCSKQSGGFQQISHRHRQGLRAWRVFRWCRISSRIIFP